MFVLNKASNYRCLGEVYYLTNMNFKMRKYVKFIHAQRRTQFEF